MTDSWLDLGAAGLQRLERQLQALSQRSVASVDDQGRTEILKTWKIPLAELLLERCRNSPARVVTSSLLGLTDDAWAKVSDEQYASANEETLRRFLLDHRMPGAYQCSCVVIDDVHNQADLSSAFPRRTLSTRRLVMDGEGILCVLRIDGRKASLVEQFTSAIDGLSSGSPLVAVSGGAQFDEMCNDVWLGSWDSKMGFSSELVSTVERILAVDRRDLYVLWEADRP